MGICCLKYLNRLGTKVTGVAEARRGDQAMLITSGLLPSFPVYVLWLEPWVI